MKKLLCVLCLLCLSACAAATAESEPRLPWQRIADFVSRNSHPTDILQKTQEQLAEGCEFRLDFSTGQQAELRWSAQEQELCFLAPEELAGFSILRDGGGLSVSFEGISAKISRTALPQGSAAVELYEALDGLLAADPETLDCDSETDGLLKVTAQNSARRDARGAETATENLQNAEFMSRNSPRGLPAIWIDVETCLPIAIQTEHWDVALALTEALCYTDG